jgi:hypothetical protein
VHLGVVSSYLLGFLFASRITAFRFSVHLGLLIGFHDFQLTTGGYIFDERIICS